MPEPTINLNKGLQALYYFDEQNFDNQRNLMRDHSGHGRHLDAVGGVTVGVEGPDSFEAAAIPSGASLQTDPVTLSYGSTDEITVAITYKLTGSEDARPLEHLEATRGFKLRIDKPDDIFDWTVYDGTNASRVRKFATPDIGDWTTDVVTFENNNQKIIRNGGLLGQDTNTNISSLLSPTNIILSDQIADIAFASVHNRVLSSAEIEYLNRLTAPRRAQL